MNVDDIRLDSSLDWRSAVRARGVVCKLVDRGLAPSSAGASAGLVCVSEYPCPVYSLYSLGVLAQVQDPHQQTKQELDRDDKEESKAQAKKEGARKRNTANREQD